MGSLNYQGAPAMAVPTQGAADSSQAPASMAAVQSVVPAGVVLPYAGPIPPTGWLLCDGSPISRTTYSKLFAAIGTTYGAGDGTTTFNLPELRGEFIRGLDQGRLVDTGRTLGSSQGQAYQQHTHGVLFSSGSGSIPGVNSTADSVRNGSSTLYAASNGATPNQNYLDTGVGAGPETRPRNVAMNYIIKYA